MKFNIERVVLRPERPTDYRETENVTREGFWNCHVPGCDEHYLLHIMRDSSAFVKELDIVAVYGEKIVGNVVHAKSVVKTDGENECGVLGLGPISVLPEYQNKGIGGCLIERTKQIARDMGYRAVFLYGDPAYYSRYGFAAAENFDIRTSDNMYAEALQVCELYADALSGITGRYFEDEVYEFDKAAAAGFDKTFPPKEKVEGTASQERFLELSRQKGAKSMIIETDRLILRPLVIADAETAYYGWVGDAKVAEYVSWLPHQSIFDTINWLKEIEWKQDGKGSIIPSENYIWGFVLKETGELFGSGGLIWEEGYKLYQVGYNIKESHWSNGYTTEAMRAILSFAAKSLGIKRVAGGHAKENLASARVLEKLGFIYDRDDVTPHVDGVRYFDSREYYLDLETEKPCDYPEQSQNKKEC